jgi:hypothetical protein
MPAFLLQILLDPTGVHFTASAAFEKTVAGEYATDSVKWEESKFRVDMERLRAPASFHATGTDMEPTLQQGTFMTRPISPAFFLNAF